MIDAFVVKYRADAQKFLPLHCDQSMISLTIPLNPTADFDGKHFLIFADTGSSANCDVGSVVSFDGRLLHGGDAITRGVRYICVAFLYGQQSP